MALAKGQPRNKCCKVSSTDFVQRTQLQSSKNIVLRLKDLLYSTDLSVEAKRKLPPKLSKAKRKLSEPVAFPSSEHMPSAKKN